MIENRFPRWPSLCIDHLARIAKPLCLLLPRFVFLLRFLDSLIARSSILDFIKFTYFYFFDYVSRFLLLLFLLLHCLLIVPFSSCQSIPIFRIELFQANVYYANFIGRQRSHDYSSIRRVELKRGEGYVHHRQVKYPTSRVWRVSSANYITSSSPSFSSFSRLPRFYGATVVFPWRLDR